MRTSAVLARLRVSDRQAAGNDLLDIALVGAEDADGQVHRQAAGEGFFGNALEGPDGGRRRAAGNEAAVHPLVAHVDALVGRLALLAEERELAVDRHAGPQFLDGRTEAIYVPAVLLRRDQRVSVPLLGFHPSASGGIDGHVVAVLVDLGGPALQPAAAGRGRPPRPA